VFLLLSVFSFAAHVIIREKSVSSKTIMVFCLFFEFPLRVINIRTVFGRDGFAMYYSELVCIYTYSSNNVAMNK